MTWGAVAGGAIAAAGSIMGGKSSDKASAAAVAAQERQNAIAREDLSPYREFGTAQMGELTNWLASPEGAYRPSVDELSTLPGYSARLKALENSAIARGGLFSGNTIQDVGEFGASEYDREIGRRGDELSRRLGLVNLGYGAAGGSAGLASNLGSSLANINMQRGASQQNMWNQLGQTGAGVAGAIQGQQNWNAFLDRFGE